MIRGGRELFGEVTISGAKNAAVAIIPAALLVDGVCRIENIPQISDVTAAVLHSGGAGRQGPRAEPQHGGDRLPPSTPPAPSLSWRAAPRQLLPAWARCSAASARPPWPCPAAATSASGPIDQHVKGFAAMGARCPRATSSTPPPRRPPERRAVYLDVVSVGATMNIMMAAALAEGTTAIENAAKEPHIVDLANFLNSMGADIKGAGTDSIRIRGVEQLHGGTYGIIPDQIEAGTYMAAVRRRRRQAAAANVIPKHMDCITAKLRRWASPGRRAGRQPARPRSGSCATPTSRRCPIPASRRICSRRSPWRSRWRRGRAS